MTDERREHPRHAASLVGEIETSAGRAEVAITRDVSARGIQILTRTPLEIGAPISIKVAFRQSVVMLEGKVLRREDVPPSVSTLWLYKVALAITPSQVVDQLMVELAEISDATAP